MNQPPAHVWLNGQVLPLSEARLSPLDHGLTVGDGVFETMQAREGNIIALRQHWERLSRSCAALGIAAPAFEQMQEALRAVMAANDLPQEARLRFTVTSGDGPMGSDRGNSSPTMLAVAITLNRWPPTERVQIVPWTRNERGALTGIKSTSYAENVRALAYAKAQGAGEGILANTKGELCEGTGSNVFIVSEGRILTPALSSGCLPGITRLLTLAACAEAGLPVEETTIPLSAFETAEEAFLTSSTRDVHPIEAINGRRLARVPGELTQRAAAALSSVLLKA